MGGQTGCSDKGKAPVRNSAGAFFMMLEIVAVCKFYGKQGLHFCLNVLILKCLYVE